jgi:hypothetical protein
LPDILGLIGVLLRLRHRVCSFGSYKQALEEIIMATRIPISVFDSGERVTLEVVQRQAKKIRSAVPGLAILESLVNEVLIVNDRRQIVFSSKNFEKYVPERLRSELLGARLGEACACQHSEEHEAGCGLSEACSQCGAFQAITLGLAGTIAQRECRLTRIVNCQPEALDLLVCASPLEVEGEKFVICSIQDISQEKRLQVLERTFFQDLVDSAGAALALSQRPKPGMKEDPEGQVEALKSGMQEVMEHVYALRDLRAAESGDLRPQPVQLNSLSVMANVAAFYARHDLASGRRLVIAPDSSGTDMWCDRALLRRILGHLIRNALEASGNGDTVTAGCGVSEGRVRWWVRNRASLSRETQSQVFHRSFSTKGSGRGIGTYSVKLLTERYLGGRCGFESAERDGTLFFVELPLCPPTTNMEAVPGVESRHDGFVPLGG